MTIGHIMESQSASHAMRQSAWNVIIIQHVLVYGAIVCVNQHRNLAYHPLSYSQLHIYTYITFQTKTDETPPLCMVA